MDISERRIEEIGSRLDRMRAGEAVTYKVEHWYREDVPSLLEALSTLAPIAVDLARNVAACTCTLTKITLSGGVSYTMSSSVASEHRPECLVGRAQAALDAMIGTDEEEGEDEGSTI